VPQTRAELRRIVASWEDHHRRLLIRTGVVLVLTVIVDALGTVAVYFAERHAKGTDITTIGDALFFTTVQLLTVSSQMANPFTTWGRIVDVLLEVWAVIVVAGVAGAMASFFLNVDQARGRRSG
jgi:drug/metabolite transporter (DMT)-like permease